jgi:membrane-bound lytic murein transglycosylase B
VPATAGASAAANPFGSPAALASAVTRAERGIRDERLQADDVARLGRFQQRAYRALAGTPAWDAEVRDLLPDDVRAAFDRNVEARRAVVAHSASRPPSEPPTTLPAWRIVEPEPVDVLERHYRDAQVATGVPWAYLAAIHLVETRMGRVVGTSSAGAVGPMQFLPSTWAVCCSAIGDPLVTRDAILGAAAYLAQHGATRDMLAALRAYNPNEGYVGAVDAYARNLLADPGALRGYHAWEVYVTTAAGTVRLPVGFAAGEPVDAAAYLAEHPEDRAPVDD